MKHEAKAESTSGKKVAQDSDLFRMIEDAGASIRSAQDIVRNVGGEIYRSYKDDRQKLSFLKPMNDDVFKLMGECRDRLKALWSALYNIN